MKKSKQNCTAFTNGTVTSIKSRGLDFPTTITVNYEVDGQNYEVRESIKLKSELYCGKEKGQ